MQGRIINVRNDGLDGSAPAFPVVFEWAANVAGVSPISGIHMKPGDTEHVLREGMTLRDYLIAHAPAVPGWFEPTLPKCPEWLNVEHITDDAVREDVKIALDASTDPATEAGRAWIEQQRQIGEQIADWNKLKRRETILQWPAYWADEQLRRRAERMLAQGQQQGGQHAAD
jgi:hypothetical protein